ncbi:MAG: STAS domain-containing protein [Solirubrobacterales bacterium]
MTPFSASFHEHPDAVVVAVKGEFDLAATTEFRTARAQALGADGALIVDLGDCTFIDSTGIACVIRSFERADSAGREFALVASDFHVRRVLELVGVPDRIPCFTSLDKALASLAPASVS